jgi:hypothetical protein
MKLTKESAALLVLVAVLVVVALAGLTGLSTIADKAKVPSLPLACNDCLQGCECGDCVKCLPAKVAKFEPEPCQCGPHKDCNCKPVKGCSCPTKSAPAKPATVNVICCFCKHSFSAPASVSRTQCPSCLAPLFVQPSSTGEVGDIKQEYILRAGGRGGAK